MRARHATPVIAFHWLTAALVAVMLATGFAYAKDLGGKAAIGMHQVTGQLLILVLIGRIATRISTQPEIASTQHAIWERQLAKTVHVALYAVLIALALTGYVAASALGETRLTFPIDRTLARSDFGEMFLDAHFSLKWILITLLTLHIAAALKHAVLDRDDTSSRMAFSLRKDRDHA